MRSKTHAVLLTLKRSTGELATYQKKMITIDDHVGIAIAGLTSDARVLRFVGAVLWKESQLTGQQLDEAAGHAVQDAVRTSHPCRPSCPDHRRQ